MTLKPNIASNRVDRTFRTAMEQVFHNKTKDSLLYRFDGTPPNIFEFTFDYVEGIEQLSSAQEEIIGGIYGEEVPEQRLLKDALHSHDNFFKVEECDLMVGQRGGKNKMAEIIVAYAVLRWVWLEDPYAIFGLSRNEPFQIVNVSQVGSRQAENVFFKRFQNALLTTKDPQTGANWFAQYAGMDLRARHGNIKQKEVTVPSPVPGTPGLVAATFDRTHQSTEGLTTWIAIIDEPSRADTKANYERAVEQYRVITANQQGNYPPGKRFTMAFSYPNNSGGDYDVIVDLVENSKSSLYNGNNENALVRKYATWEFRPDVTRDWFNTKYDQDPIDAARRFECVIPPSKYKFFSPHLGKIRDCINPLIESPVEWKPTYNTAKRTVKGIEQELEFTAIELLNVQGDNRKRIFAIDAGKTNDAFIISGGYAVPIKGKKPTIELSDYDREGQLINQQITVKAKPVVDIQLIWKPDPEHPVDFLNVEDVLRILVARHFPNTAAVISDTYESESLHAHMRNLGVPDFGAQQASNRKQVMWYTITRAAIWNNQYEYLNGPHVEELEELIKENNRVDHPDGGSKDASDTIALIGFKAQEVEMEEETQHFDFGDPHEYDDVLHNEVSQYKHWINIYIQRLKKKPEDGGAVRRFIRDAFGVDLDKEKAAYLWKLYQADQVEDAEVQDARYNKQQFTNWVLDFQDFHDRAPEGPGELSTYLRKDKGLDVSEHDVLTWWELWEQDTGYVRSEHLQEFQGENPDFTLF